MNEVMLVSVLCPECGLVWEARDSHPRSRVPASHLHENSWTHDHCGNRVLFESRPLSEADMDLYEWGTLDAQDVALTGWLGSPPNS